MPLDDRPTVYSTDSEIRICPRCKQYPCRCPGVNKSLPPNQQKAILQVEKKGRGGKTVTIVRGLVLSPQDLKALAKTLKEACGTGGTIKDDTIEIQGDQRTRLSAKLKSLGYKTNV
jgi:translation initiation factor 1